MTHHSDVARVGRAPVLGSSRPGLQGANEYQGGVNYYGDNNLPQYGKGMQMAPIWGMSIVPLTKQAAGLAGSQTPGGAGALTLTAGTGVTLGTIAGTTAYILDVARSISVTTAGSESGVNLTITGWDWYLQPQTATLALPASATTVNSTKTFKAISALA